jgi:acyl-CoA reductase-like NAD-dependent aldehyde dehydrogenase
MSADKTLQVFQAYDGALIEEVPLQNWQEANEMLNKAQAMFNHRDKWLPAHRRMEILRRLAELMQEKAHEFSLLIAREGGKPLADAKIEVARAINGVELAREEISRLKGEQIPMDLSGAGAGRLAFTTKEPIGVVLAVSAFNHPLNLIVHQVAPAIACGCPVIVKPAANTPLSCIRFIELVERAGLPGGWCQYCVCDRGTATKLISDSRVAFLTFIGSAKVGWELRRQISPGTRCALEHGGVAPVIVAKDADLEKAIPSVVKGAFYHAGQVCVSVQRVFVDNSILKLFIDLLKNKVDKLNVGDPTNIETEVGPLITPKEVDRVEHWVNDAVIAGATLVSGGKRISDFCYQPSILLDPPVDANVSTLEIFGPVVCVYGYDDIAQAIKQANSLSVSFQAAVYTQDIDRALHSAQSLNAAAVMVNEHTAFRVDWMPFAGRATSGLGVGGIPYTMDELVQDKLLVINTAH